MQSDPTTLPQGALAPVDLREKDIENEEVGRAQVINSFDNDSDMVGLNILERKMILINRGLNATGMGRYQWCIFVLCGFGYLLDLAFAMLFGLILSPMTQELNVATADQGDVSSCFNAGLCAGAWLWGLSVDIIGRKWAFNLTLLVTAFFGLLLAVPSNYAAICALAALCGLGLGGNIPIDATILMEFVPSKSRWVIILVSVFQPLGVFLCSLICWGLIPSNSCDIDLPSCRAPGLAEGAACCAKGDNMGWRYATYTVGAICLGMFLIRFLVFNFKESPKFLLTKGKEQEAVEVVYHVAKFNKIDPATLGLSVEDFRALEQHYVQTSSDQGLTALEPPKPKPWYNLSHLKLLFVSKKVAYLTLLIFAIYICDYWAFSLAGAFLPKILLLKGAARSTTVKETYTYYIAQALCGIPGVAIGAALVEIRWLGQKWSMAITAALMGVSLFLFAVIDSQEGNVAFNCLEYFFQSSFNAVLYGSAPLWFHTAIRGTGVGTASTLGRLFGIVAPLIGAHILANTSTNDVLYVAGAPMFGVALASLLLPNIGKTNRVY